jgi:hypothetical protein
MNNPVILSICIIRIVDVTNLVKRFCSIVVRFKNKLLTINTKYYVVEPYYMDDSTSNNLY